MNGPWRVVFSGLFNNVILTSFTQTGSSLSLPDYQFNGTIDPSTGQFLLLGVAGACPPNRMTGVASADGRFFNAGIDVYGPFQSCPLTPNGIGVFGSRCGNGVVDPGEQCDDQNIDDGDCCTAFCTVAVPSGTPCTGSNRCFVATCDGAGACVQSSTPDDGRSCDDGVFCNGADTCSSGTCAVHPGSPCGGQCLDTCNESAHTCYSPTNSPCDDGLFCNGGDGCYFGVCALHAGDPCVNLATCQACNEGADQCAAPTGTTCAADGRACTLDTCDGNGSCAHPAQPAGTVCRPSTGTCDLVDACDGSSPDCPADAFVGSGTPCGTCQTCDGEGTCDGRPRPASVCKQPIGAGAAQLKLVNAGLDARDHLTWKWTRGEATSAAEFGSPLTAGDHATLCVFDDSTANPALLFAAGVPTGPGWSTTGSTFRFRGTAATGVRSVTLAAGTAGRAKIALKGMGDALPLPLVATPLTLPIRTQLQLDAGGCWEARFSNATRNTGAAFKAQSD